LKRIVISGQAKADIRAIEQQMAMRILSAIHRLAHDGLQQYAIYNYNRALSTNPPFPKTRRIVFLNNRPATLPGWAELAIE